jgi:hypothetical protein
MTWTGYRHPQPESCFRAPQPNYALDGGFWQFMRQHYSAHYVVAEVKNLTRQPGKKEILQVANYLSRHGTGLFALILARRDLDRTGKWICQEQWVLHDKLIVGLDDDDVFQMVKTKLPVATRPSWPARRSRTSV